MRKNSFVRTLQSIAVSGKPSASAFLLAFLLAVPDFGNSQDDDPEHAASAAEARRVSKYQPGESDAGRMRRFSKMTDERLGIQANRITKDESEFAEGFKNYKKSVKQQEKLKRSGAENSGGEEFRLRKPDIDSLVTPYLKNKIGLLDSIEGAVNDIEFRSLFYVSDCNERATQDSLDSLKRLIRLLDQGHKAVRDVEWDLDIYDRDKLLTKARGDVAWAQKRYATALQRARKLFDNIEAAYRAKCGKADPDEKRSGKKEEVEKLPKEKKKPKEPIRMPEEWDLGTRFKDAPIEVPEDPNLEELLKEPFSNPDPGNTPGNSGFGGTQPPTGGFVAPDKWGNQNFTGLGGIYTSPTFQGTIHIRVGSKNTVYLGLWDSSTGTQRIYRGTMTKNRGVLAFQPREIGFFSKKIPMKVQRKLLSEKYAMRLDLSYNPDPTGGVMDVVMRLHEDFFEWDPGKSLTRRTYSYRYVYHKLFPKK